MTFERFKEIYKASGLNLTKFEGSPQLIDALCKASEGDFTAFDDIERKLIIRDRQSSALHRSSRIGLKIFALIFALMLFSFFAGLFLGLTVMKHL